MTAPWPQLLERWMLDRGTLEDGVPIKPMSPQTVTNRMKPIRKMASDLGFLGKGSKSFQSMRPKVLCGYMKMRFPDGGFKKRNAWNTYARALKTLGAYLHFEARGRHNEPIWSAQDLEVLRDCVKIKADRRSTPPSLSEDLIRRWETLLDYIKVKEPETYAFAAWSYHTCMRYDEVRKMDLGFETGSAILLPDGNLEVDGKRSKGEEAKRKVPLQDEAREVLKWWKRYRKKNGIECVALFPAGGRWSHWERRSVHSTTYNRRLRLMARDSGLFRGTCNDKGDKATGELKLLKSHTIGRHAGATVLAHGGGSLIDIQRQTGHRSAKILDGYINVDPKSVAKRLGGARTAWRGEGVSADQVEEEVNYDQVAEELLANPKVRAALLKKLLGDA